jgi:large subunit ribosomal protein L32
MDQFVDVLDAEGVKDYDLCRSSSSINHLLIEEDKNMPLPKRRHSKTRGRKRRTHWKLGQMNLVPCPQCKHPKLTHRICAVCGYYDGRQVIEVKTKEKNKKKKG